MEKDVRRCSWATHSDLERDYHDTEWGVAVHDDRKLFEYLLLDGAQAGLSWLTVLKKRENYRRLFDDFNPEKIALYDRAKVAELLLNPGIIRNKLKVNSAVTNAQAFLVVQEEFGSFDEFIWGFVDGTTIVNSWKRDEDMPANTKISDEMSKVLKARGFKFVGSTICYAFMQAAGLVNDHRRDCFRFSAV